MRVSPKFKFVFRIRRCYFNAIKNGQKTIEYRKDSEFWKKRLEKIKEEKVPNRDGWMPENAEAIFICGKEQPLRRRIIYIERIETPTNFSEQGKVDVNTPSCLAFHLVPSKLLEVST